MLSDPANYGALAGHPDITVKLLSKQMVALEGIIASIYTAL